MEWRARWLKMIGPSAEIVDERGQLEEEKEEDEEDDTNDSKLAINEWSEMREFLPKWN
jgi:hypothetical protein